MKKQIFLISLSLLILVGCERKRSEHNYERTIWVNPDVECCGVKDPLNNLGWLKEKSRFYEYNEAPPTNYNYIFLYRNKLTYKDHIVVNDYNRFNWIVIYDCESNLIGGGSGYSILKREQIVNREFLSEGPEPCDTCDEFFQTHVLIDTIAYSDVKL